MSTCRRGSAWTLAFERVAISAEPKEALHHYRGVVRQGRRVTCSVEVEEWIFSTRERLSSIARGLHLEAARLELGLGRREAAWSHVKSAVALTDEMALEPEPAARLLQTFKLHRVRAPDGWWRALTAFGFDRRLTVDTAVDAMGRVQPNRVVPATPRPGRLHARSARVFGQRRTPRRG